MRSHLFRTGRRETKLLSTPSMPMSNLAIRLDEPLLSPASIRRPSSAEMFKYVAGVFLTDAFKFAIVAFFIAFVTSVLTQSDASSNSPQSIWEKLSGGFTSLYRFVRAPFSRLADSIAARRAAAGIGPPVPMTFDNESGWGVCTYLGGEPVRKSGYVRHDFSLPEKDNVVPLSLGQNVALCSLDNHDNVVQGEFYPYSKRNLQGKLSILLPAGDDVETELGRDRSNFAKVLKEELQVGDEIAMKLGDVGLTYRGQFLPVKEMVFITAGDGVIPAIDQVRTVLPEGASSVQLASVLWCCKDTKDFDIADKELETEYKKYPSKLAVTCVDDDFQGSDMKDNEDIVESVPDFLPGTMAIVAGPRSFRAKAKKYLSTRGYPSDTICVME